MFGSFRESVYKVFLKSDPGIGAKFANQTAPGSTEFQA